MVREPQQERSIEKKNKIIQAGYELFSEVGYYSTNTAEIAKRAGVSTGIVYGYFLDKRDILLSVLQIYIEKISEPLYKLMDVLTAPVSFDEVMPKIVDSVLKMHKENEKIHNTLHSLATSDETVNGEFMDLEGKITENIAIRLKNLGVTLDGLNERVHLAMNLIQSFAHEYVFDNHDYIDYKQMRKFVEKTLINLFS